MITIDEYDKGKVGELWQVYYTSIHMVCCQHYSQQQLDAWAPKNFSLAKFEKIMQKLNPIVASVNGEVVGYTDLQQDGLMDHFFVHGQYQSKGVGTRLINTVFERAQGKTRLFSNVSHTAKPFYLRHGFVVEKVQRLKIRGVDIENNLMGCVLSR